MTYYEKQEHIFNKVDKIKTESAIALLREYLVDVLPSLHKFFTIHIDNSTVYFVSRSGFYPRYFVEINLDSEKTTFNRFYDLEKQKGQVNPPCQDQQGTGRNVS